MSSLTVRRTCLARALAASVLPWLLLLAAASPLQGQVPGAPSREASFLAGASFGDGETALALTAGLMFELAPRIGLRFELDYARKLDFTLDLCPAPRVCVVGGQLPVTGRMVSLMPHLAIDLSPASWRLRTYVQTGIGWGHLRQRYFLRPVPASGEAPIELTRSKPTIAWSCGGGATLPVTTRLSIGADVRVLQLLDEEAGAERFITPAGALTTVRIGVRAGWGF